VSVDRRSYIGGGDAAAIAGVGLWGSPYSVWAYKTGATPEEDREITERMQWGLLLEQPVAQEWARREGVTELRKAVFRRHQTIPYIAGHPDFMGVHPVDGKVLIETKLSDRASEWEGEDGDQIPLQYFLQVQHYLLITGLRVGYLVVLVRGNALRSYRIERDDEIIAGLIETYAEFWQRVHSGEAPEVDGHDATAEALRRRYPRGEDSEIVADLPAVGLIESLLEVRRALKDEEERERLIVGRIKDRMGTVARLVAPGVVVSWKNNKDSSKTDWASVAKAYRSIIEGASIDTIADLDTIESIHTNTIPGARVFRVTAKAEE